MNVFNHCREASMRAWPNMNWRNSREVLPLPLIQTGQRVSLKQDVFDAARDALAFGCHDALLLRNRNGILEVLLVVRSEPSSGWQHPMPETAPINDFLWFIGGRVVRVDDELIAAGPIPSMITRASIEVGDFLIDHLQGIYVLGHGVTYFPAKMTYELIVDEEIRATREAQLTSSPYTHNLVYAIETDGGFEVKGDSSVAEPLWVTSESWTSEVRQYASAYLQTFVDAVFEGFGH